MPINTKQLYHGAVLYQIAEHPQFTAINALANSNNAFRINDDIAVYPKFCTNPTGPYREYRFTFNSDNLHEIQSIVELDVELHLALVCVKDSRICCLPYQKLTELIEARKNSFGAEEEQYVVIVNYEPGKRFRVNMNKPGTRGKYVSAPIRVRQSACPNDLFRSQSN